MASEDVRKMREERAAANRRKAMPAKAGKRILIAAVVVLAIAGIVYAVQQNAETRRECPGHWHATFGVYVDGERVPFPQPPYQMSPGGKLPMRMHMHSPSQEILHFEPAPAECLGVADTFELLDVDLAAGSLTFEEPHGTFDGEYEAEGNKTVRYFVQPRDGELAEEPWSALRNRQLDDGEKLLVAYGDYTMDEISAMMDAISAPPG